MPRLSIITVNLNNASGLQKTIESVVIQNFIDYEYIIIDGGSSDASVDVIKKHQSSVNYWSSEKDEGIYNAMNKGISKALGEYCLFLNSGDTLVNEHVLETVFMDFPDKDIVYGKLQRPDGVFTYPEKLTLATFFFGSIGHPATFLRKKLFEKYGYYNEEYKIVSDWEFFVLALVKNNCSYKRIDTVISYFELDGVSNDRRHKAVEAAEREMVLKKLFPLMYDDYIELKDKRRELEFYKNSRLVQLMKNIQESKLYKKFRSLSE